MKRIAILTTKQNYVWSSMQEVIPALELCWKKSTDQHLIINVDTEPLRDYLPFIFKADVLIIIAYNETISRAIYSIREELKIQIPIIFHLYGHATIGLWPELRFNTLPILNQGDIFIGTCDGDINCMKLCLTPHQTVDISYPFLPLDNESIIPVKERSFVYIGRLSDQKNIDVLIEAYSISLKKVQKLPIFYIFGEEDFLGFPNLGIKSSNCLEKIKNLIIKHNLSNHIFLMGKKTREEIYSQIGKDHTFLSASTHSDENFGMAAMRTISLGGNVVLSKWGGHNNYSKYCPDQTYLIDVQINNGLPQINAEEFSKQIINSLNYKFKNDATMPKYFSPDYITEQFKELLMNISFSEKPLVISKEVETIFKQQQFFEKNGNIQQSFTGFEDPILNLFYRAYQ